MQLDVTKLTPEAHRAIVECLRIAARRGRLLREAREREQAALRTDSVQTDTTDKNSEQSPQKEKPRRTNDDQ